MALGLVYDRKKVSQEAIYRQSSKEDWRSVIVTIYKASVIFSGVTISNSTATLCCIYNFISNSINIQCTVARSLFSSKRSVGSVRAQKRLN